MPCSRSCAAFLLYKAEGSLIFNKSGAKIIIIFRVINF